MSLINDVLQNLERRNAESGEDHSAARDVRFAPAVSSSNNFLLMGASAVAGAALVGAGWFFMMPRPVTAVARTEPSVAAPVVARPALAAPIAAAPIAAAPAVAPVPPPSAVAAPVPPPSPVAPAAATAMNTRDAAPAEKAEPKPVTRIPDAPPIAVAMAASAPARAASSASAPAKATDPIVEAPKPARGPEPAVVEPAVAARTMPPAAEPRLLKSVSPQQMSENLYRQGVALAEQGKVGEARDALKKSLEQDSRNASARQLLARSLVESNNIAEASELLREGIRLSPEQTGFSMNLARLQMESANTSAAMATLERGLTFAADDPAYQAFYAVLLQRSERHDEAVKHYLNALRSDPSMPNWLIGIGISLQSLGKDTDSMEAFQRARDTGRLPPSLLSFVEQRISQLKR